MLSSVVSQMMSALVLAFFIGYSEANLSDLFRGICLADTEESWTYRRLDLIKGPIVWGVRNRECYGSKQSPIDIETGNVETNENLEPLSLENYNVPLSEATIENNGHTIEVKPRDSVPRTVKVNGDVYTLQQFHFHWGFKYSEGSEHGIDGQFYAMELHFVHRSEGGSLAVVGVFLQEQDQDNEELQKIVDKLPEVRYKGTEAEINSDLNLLELLPQSPISYYRYDGSLTTPPCSEGVTWSVLKEPIKVGRAQMEKFRSLYSATEEKATEACHLSQNYRPLQPIGDRTVYQPQ